MSQPDRTERQSASEQRVSPIPDLVAFIKSEHPGDDFISFPSATVTAISQCRSDGIKYSVKDIEDLVHAIDSYETPFCKEIDGPSHVVISSVVINSMPCCARYRGFFIIAESLRSGPDDDPAMRKQQLVNKLRLAHVLPWLLERIAMCTETDQMRRGMSVLALELLEACRENVQNLRSNQSEKWLGLAEVLKHGKCHILRLLVGSIIREMLFSGIPPEAFWTLPDMRLWRDRFPLASEQSPRWLIDFNSYLEGMERICSLLGKSSVHFARAIYITDRFSATSHDSTILLIVSDFVLKVFVQAPSGGQATFVDVLLKDVISEGLTKSTIVQTDADQHTVQIDLASPSVIRCFINADSHNRGSLELMLDEREIADQVSCFMYGATTFESSSPGPVLEHGLEEQADLADTTEQSPGMVDYDRLIDTATKATSLIPPRKQVATSTSQRTFQKNTARSQFKPSKEPNPISKARKIAQEDQHLTSEFPKSHRTTQATSQVRRRQGLTHTKQVPVEPSSSVDVRGVRNAILVDDGKLKISHEKSGPLAKLDPNIKPLKKSKRVFDDYTQSATKNNDEYDFQKSPPLSLREVLPAHSANRLTEKVTKKSQKARKATYEKQTTEGSSEKDNDPSATQSQQGSQRPRRAAALKADMKIRGIDTSNNEHGQQPGCHNGRSMPLIKDASAQIQPYARETARSHKKVALAVRPSENHEVVSIIENILKSPSGSSFQESAIKTKKIDASTNIMADVAQIFIHTTQVAPSGPNHEMLNGRELEPDNEALEAQMSQTTHTIAAAQEGISDTISKVLLEKGQEKQIPSPSEAVARHNGPLGIRDPFTLKLGAVVAKDKHSVTESTNGVASIEADRVDPRKVPQEATHASGPPSSIRKQMTLCTPSSRILVANSNEPIKKLKRKAIVPSASTLKNLKRRALEPIDAGTSTKRTPLLLASRKTPLISFSASGPRNQGILIKGTGQKPKLPMSAIQRAIYGNEDVELKNAADTSEVLDTPDCADEEQQLPLGRKNVPQKERLQSPSLSAEWPAILDLQEPPLNVQKRPSQQSHTNAFAPKVSSQTTRVDHNGSPMPIRHMSNTSFTKDRTHPAKRDQDSENEIQEDVLFADDEGDHPKDEQMLQRDLPSRSNISPPSMPPVDTYAWVKTSKNKKQIPSSPEAPSMTSALTAHRACHTGELINSRTDEIIVPSKPEDPSTGREVKSSSFSQLLWNANEQGVKRPAKAKTGDLPKKVRLSTCVSMVEDPDRTLVEMPRTPNKSKLKTTKDLSDSSSKEGTSEREASPTLIEHENEDTPKQWEKALQPHQRNVMDILTQISHQLLAHLVKSEDAFMDLVNDYKTGGNMLINHLEREHEAANLAQIARSEALKRKVIGLYQKTNADLERHADGIPGRTKELEKEWRANQVSLTAKVNAALALHAG